MIEIAGTHGTTVTCANAILGCGEILPSAGRRGAGAYLWKQGEFSISLARAWYEQCMHQNRYRGQENQQCAVILATMQVKELEFYDSTTDKNRDKSIAMVYRLCRGYAARGAKLKGVEAYAKIYDAFISKIENISKCNIKVAAYFVAAPSCGDYYHWLPQPTCYVLKQGKNLALSIVDGESI